MLKRVKKLVIMSIVCCLLCGSVSAYAAYQYGVDWYGPYTDSISGSYCKHSVTYYTMEFLDSTWRHKASTVHSKSSTSNYTRLRYEFLGAIDGDTGRCYASNGTKSNAEVGYNSKGTGFSGSRKIYCGTDGY